MTFTQFLMDIARLMIPGLLVGGVVYMMLTKYFHNENKRRLYELKMNNQRSALPIRLQAYERLTILLERMSVNNLILRLKHPGMSAADLHSALLSEIRSEFEHNFSQQLYISPDVWNMVRHAKEETVKMVNSSYSSLPKDADSMDLTKAIFEASLREEVPPTYMALLHLKREAADLF